MATFVLKVNAHPAVPSFPTSPAEWDNIQFFGPAPRSTIGSGSKPLYPKPSDRVHVWINEKGGGGGYTGYGTVLVPYAHFSSEKNPVFDFRLTEAKLLPRPIGGDDFWAYTGTVEAMSSLRRYTLRQLLWMDDPQAADFEAALRKVVIEKFGAPLKNFIGM